MFIVLFILFLYFIHLFILNNKCVQFFGLLFYYVGYFNIYPGTIFNVYHNYLLSIFIIILIIIYVYYTLSF